MATSKVAPPPGFVLDNDSPAPPEGFVLDGRESPFLNPGGEAVASVASGMLGSAAGGLSGLVGSVLPGPQGQGAAWSEKVRQQLTYQPRSEMAKEILRTALAPIDYLSKQTDKAGGAVTDLTGSPLAGTAVKTGLDFLPSLVAKGLKGPVSSLKTGSQVAVDAKNLLNSVKNETLTRALDEGYTVPPSAIRGSFVTNRLESTGGKAAVGQEASLRNQAITDKIAGREAGIPAGQPINETNLRAARDVLSQPYRDVAALSPIAKSTLERLKQSRADATAAWQHYNRTADPAILVKAKNFDRLSQTYENVIEKQAIQFGKPDLVSQLKQAREGIAKNYDVERAWNPGSGEVDAVAIGRMLDRGKKLSGGLETIGRFALAFRPYAREGSRIPTPGVSKSEALASAALGTAGAASGVGLWPALAPLASHPARALALSEMMRPSVGLKLPMSIQAAETGTQLPFYLMPGLGLIPQERSQ